MWQCSMRDNVPLHGCTVPQSHSEIVILLVPRTDPVPLMGALVWVLHCCLLFAAHAFYTSPLPNDSTHTVSAIEMDEDPTFVFNIQFNRVNCLRPRDHCCSLQCCGSLAYLYNHLPTSCVCLHFVMTSSCGTVVQFLI